ncbi:hypothetical protein ACH5RR_029721 [Cinchona calisaya]|uniref:Uncharacterized protein n=1 Tax=Cinchona calisaya TaxID=153742 RepID=A0ABD2YSG3_9GENT
MSSLKEGGPHSFRFQNMWVRHHSFLTTGKDNRSQPISGSEENVASKERQYENMQTTEAREELHAAQATCRLT